MPNDGICKKEDLETVFICINKILVLFQIYSLFDER